MDTIWDDDSFLSIRHNQRIDSGVLHTAMSKLAACRPGTTVISAQQLDEFDAGFTSESWLQTLRHTILSATAQVFLPINVDRVHWALAVVDNQAKAVKLYDSEGGPDTGARNVMNNILPWIVTEEYTTTLHKSPVQPGGSDECGVAVFLNTLQLLTNPQLTDIDITPQAMYWLSGRLAMLELCRAHAPSDQSVSRVETDLDAAVGPARRSAQNSQGEKDAVDAVYSSLRTLNHGAQVSNDISRAMALFEKMAMNWDN